MFAKDMYLLSILVPTVPTQLVLLLFPKPAMLCWPSGPPSFLLWCAN